MVDWFGLSVLRFPADEITVGLVGRRGQHRLSSTLPTAASISAGRRGIITFSSRHVLTTIKRTNLAISQRASVLEWSYILRANSTAASQLK